MSFPFAILVLSCDRYADVWPAFFKCFRENFPVVNWPIYIGSNTIKCNEPGVVTIFSGSDPDWSTSYKRILEQIPEKKLFVILEDLFLSSQVDEHVLATLVNFMLEKNANHIRYWGRPAPDILTENPLIGECKRGAPYRSTVCGFWDRDYLLKLLLEGENPWDFEILGSYRTSYSDGFYATTSRLCNYQNMIEKGRWTPASIEWVRKNGVNISLEVRPTLKDVSWLISMLQKLIFTLVLQMPWHYRVKLMNQLRKIFVSY